MGDTSLVQLRDAIDVIIGKLDDKIDASQLFSKSSVFERQSKIKQLKRCKERAASNDIVSMNTKQSSVPKEWLLHQLGLRSNDSQDQPEIEKSHIFVQERCESIETIKLNE